jgi:hypothetical protein
MRRILVVCAALAAIFLGTAPVVVSSAPVDPTATTTTTVVGDTTTSTTSTTSTTTTTLPSAVTTVPEGCALPPTAQAVFVGTVNSVDVAAAEFRVTQLRAGSLDGYLVGDVVSVRYGADVKYVEVGTTYIVGVKIDPISSRLSSSVRDAAELFGGAEVAGSNVKCPEFEDPARTINIDGSRINAGLFSKFFDNPLLVVASVLLPPILVVMALAVLVWFRRGIRT